MSSHKSAQTPIIQSNITEYKLQLHNCLYIYIYIYIYNYVYTVIIIGSNKCCANVLYLSDKWSMTSTVRRSLNAQQMKFWRSMKSSTNISYSFGHVHFDNLKLFRFGC